MTVGLCRARQPYSCGSSRGRASRCSLAVPDSTCTTLWPLEGVRSGLPGLSHAFVCQAQTAAQMISLGLVKIQAQGGPLDECKFL